MRSLLVTLSVDLSRDQHQQTSCGHWSKLAPLTRLIRVARLGMNPNAMRVLTAVLLVATPMMQAAILQRITSLH